MEALATNRHSIKNWSVEDRPREKLQNKGRTNLTDAELIAILIGTGNKNETAVELSRRLLLDHGNDLNYLCKQRITDLTRYRGIGDAKAISIIAALELGRRRKQNDFDARAKVNSSRVAFQLLRSELLDLPHEEFWMICLNRANKCISKSRISLGGVAGTVADIKLIFKYALEQLASSIIVCHNHPSGNLKPSRADKKLTERISKAGAIMDIPLMDHLIISDYNYFSFADNDLL